MGNLYSWHVAVCVGEEMRTSGARVLAREWRRSGPRAASLPAKGQGRVNEELGEHAGECARKQGFARLGGGAWMVRGKCERHRCC